MKIAVMGAGAMGSVYAGLLTEGGHDVWAVDVWREHVDAIRERGLRVEGASGDRVVRLNATTDPSEPGVCDLVVVATKAAQVGDAAHAAAALIGPDTLVLTIQNGLGAGERICHHMDASRVLLGVAGGFGASMRGPGHVHHNGMQLIRLGEMSGGITERLENVAQAWCAGGFNVKTFDDIEQLVWEKFVCNVTFSGPCTVLEATIGEVMSNPDAWPVATTCAEEAFAAGKAKGVNFSFDDATKYVTEFGEKMPASRPSMLLDYMAGRRSEIDAINGMVPVVAREVGTAAPVNEMVVALVKAKETMAQARRDNAK